MCGIFGYITNDRANINRNDFISGIEELLLLSETRGKEASGICCVNQKEIQIYKKCVRAKELISTRQFRHMLDTMIIERGYMVMGHARMVTNGDVNNNENNQPIVRNDLVCIHNGIIVNDLELWEKNPNLLRNAEVDTEIFLALMEKYNYQNDLLRAFKQCLDEIQGSLSVALMDRTSNYMLLYTNVGSLYIVESRDRQMILFASEQYILEQTIKKEKMDCWFKIENVRQIVPQSGILVNIKDCTMQEFRIEEANRKIEKGITERKLIYVEQTVRKNNKNASMRYKGDLSRVEKLLQIDSSKIQSLRRCSRCLLPETFPGIQFDESGVCSLCGEYEKKTLKGEKRLKEVLNSRKNDGSRYDCIVPLSGGRDSCYMLHYIVKELKLKPVAYTYDWGMITDLARRNIQRMCSALEVEHILISADIARKRKNIYLNVKAWLKHPQLATVPLFMAGDKQFFYYAQMLKKQMHIDNIIFGMNSLEETKFKVRFASNNATGKNGIHYDLSNKNKYNLFMAYAKEFIKNPAYINRSLLDSFAGFLSYYILPKDYIQLFDYIPWEQKIVEDTIVNEYNFEKSKGTDETWRIGDGTAPFYNYIYYKMAGFTEFDTFKSNQIREGMISREDALKSLGKANQISAEDFVWYCNAINIDPIETLNIVNRQKTLYDK